MFSFIAHCNVCITTYERVMASCMLQSCTTHDLYTVVYTEFLCVTTYTVKWKEVINTAMRPRILQNDNVDFDV